MPLNLILKEEATVLEVMGTLKVEILNSFGKLPIMPFTKLDRNSFESNDVLH